MKHVIKDCLLLRRSLGLVHIIFPSDRKRSRRKHITNNFLPCTLYHEVRERALGVHSIVNIRWKFRSSLTFTIKLICEISYSHTNLKSCGAIKFLAFLVAPISLRFNEAFSPVRLDSVQYERMLAMLVLR